MERALSERFGERVRLMRAARGWSQSELAERAGISPNHAGSIERNEKVPGLDIVESMARAFSVPASELLTDGDPPGDSWVKQLAALGGVVPSEKRELMLSLMAGLIAVLSRSVEVGGSYASMTTIRASVDDLTVGLEFEADDPKLSSIVALLRARTPEQLEQAYRLLLALWP